MNRIPLTFTAALLIGTTFVLAAPSPVAAEHVEVCFGRQTTISSHELTVTGTDGPDVIVASANGAQVNGRGGNDFICGGSGKQYIDGRGGDDSIDGGLGNDALAGQSGDDRLQGGTAMTCSWGIRGATSCSVVGAMTTCAAWTATTTCTTGMGSTA